MKSMGLVSAMKILPVGVALLFVVNAAAQPVNQASHQPIVQQAQSTDEIPIFVNETFECEGENYDVMVTILPFALVNQEGQVLSHQTSLGHIGLHIQPRGGRSVVIPAASLAMFQGIPSAEDIDNYLQEIQTAIGAASPPGGGIVCVENEAGTWKICHAWLNTDPVQRRITIYQKVDAQWVLVYDSGWFSVVWNDGWPSVETGGSPVPAKMLVPPEMGLSNQDLESTFPEIPTPLLQLLP